GRGRYVSAHTSLEQGLAYHAKNLVGRRVADVLPADQVQTAMDAFDEARRVGVSRHKTVRLVGQDGEWVWFELAISYVAPRQGTDERFIVVSRNITDRRREIEQLNRLSQAVEQSPSSTCITDLDGKIIYVNRAFTHMTQYTFQEVLGLSLHGFCADNNPEGIRSRIRSVVNRRQPWHGEVRYLTKAGKTRICHRTVHAMTDSDDQISSYLILDNDVTNVRQTAEQLQRLSNFDQLTGLPNRARLIRSFDYLLQKETRAAVLWINLNRFKEINNALGHQTGDLVLREVADRFHNLLRPQDLLSRPAADDFIMVLCDAGPSLAARKAQKALDAMSLPLILSGRAISLSASIGVSLYPMDGSSAQILLEHAETAMHRCKEEVPGSYCYFRVEMREDTARKLGLTIALKQALANDEFHLEYQPQVCLKTGRILGAEALLRWYSPIFGNVAPIEFISVAEESGSIISIGEWVLQTALEQMSRWSRAGLELEQMAVNISAVQFERADFADVVKGVLQDSALPAHRLELELTEAIAMRAPETTAIRLKQLRSEGVKISIDDFGTGYSSLSYLKRFNINPIKIDRSFIRDITSDTDDQAIAR